ncbi:hypothetical protein JCM18237_06480 [Halorubrum luteum]
MVESGDGGERERTSGVGNADPAVSSGRALVAVGALCFVPMTVVPSGDGLTFVTLWGFLNTSGGPVPTGVQLYPVWSFFLDGTLPIGVLPGSIRVWPVALGFHLLAAASAAGGVALGREDRRVTGGLLVLAALASLWVTVGVAGRFGVGRTVGWLTVLPTGAAATIAVALVGYGRDLREGPR